MKKIILLLALFVALSMNAQTPTNTVGAGKFKAYTATKDNTATRVVVQDSITKEYRWVLKSSLSGGTNYIPLSGTETGIPVTGDIEFDNSTESRRLYTSDAGAYIEMSTNGNVSINDESGGDVVMSGIILKGNSPSANGITGVYDYSDNLTDLDYTQKKYVDDAVSGATGTQNLQQVYDNGGLSSPYGYVQSVDGLTEEVKSFQDGGGLWSHTLSNGVTNTSNLNASPNTVEFTSRNITTNDLGVFNLTGGHFYIRQRNTANNFDTTFDMEIPSVTGARVRIPATAYTGVRYLGTSINGVPFGVDGNAVISTGSGTLTSVSVVSANGITGSVANATTTPAITLSLGAITPTSVNVSGATASTIAEFDASKNLISATKGTAYNKNFGTGTTNIPEIGATLNNSRALSTDGSGKIVTSTTTSTELGYVNGVTSAIQTQIDGKGTASISGGTTNYIQKQTGTNTLGNSLVYDNGSMMGIGTASPNAYVNAVIGVSDFRISQGASNLTPTISAINTGGSGKAVALLAGTNGALFEFDSAGYFDVSSNAKTAFTGNTNGVGGTSRFRILSDGRTGIGITSPTARLHIPASTSTANSGQMKFENSTAAPTTPERGLVGMLNDNLIFDAGSTAVRYTLAKTLTNTATLDFPSTSPGATSSLTITVTGASDGDSLAMGYPSASTTVNGLFWAQVTSANTVTVYYMNTDTITSRDPASGTFRASVLKY